MWRCQCGGSHFVTVRRYWEPGERSVLVEEFPGPGWQERLRAAWAALGGRHHSWCEVILTPGDVAEMVAALTEGDE